MPMWDGKGDYIMWRQSLIHALRKAGYGYVLSIEGIYQFDDPEDKASDICAWSKTKVNTYRWRLIASDVASDPTVIASDFASDKPAIATMSLAINQRSPATSPAIERVIASDIQRRWRSAGNRRCRWRCRWRYGASLATSLATRRIAGDVAGDPGCRWRHRWRHCWRRKASLATSLATQRIAGDVAGDTGRRWRHRWQHGA